MSVERNGSFVLDVIRAIEVRDLEKVGRSYHPKVEFLWQPGLPYGGHFEGPSVMRMNQLFAETWLPLQPTEATRRMDAELIGGNAEGDVVIRYRQRGLSSEGELFEAETLALYRVVDGLLARAQMFYFDLPGLLGFLNRAGAVTARA